MADYLIRPSRRLRLSALALHGLAAVSLWLAALPWPAQVAGSLIVFASGLRAARGTGQTQLRCREDGQLELSGAEGFRAYRLLPGSVVLPGLCLLALRAADTGQRRWLGILPDSLPAEDFRRLRVWLRWKAAPSDAG